MGDLEPSLANSTLTSLGPAAIADDALLNGTSVSVLLNTTHMHNGTRDRRLQSEEAQWCSEQQPCAAGSFCNYGRGKSVCQTCPRMALEASNYCYTLQGGAGVDDCLSACFGSKLHVHVAGPLHAHVLPGAYAGIDQSGSERTRLSVTDDTRIYNNALDPVMVG